MIVFGGHGDDGAYFNDVHVLDLNTWTWFPQQNTGNVPSPRSYGAGIWVETSNVFLFYGGRYGSTTYSELYAFTLDTEDTATDDTAITTTTYSDTPFTTEETATSSWSSTNNEVTDTYSTFTSTFSETSESASTSNLSSTAATTESGS